MTKQTYTERVASLRRMKSVSGGIVEKRISSVLLSAFDELTSLLQLTTKDTLTYANYTAKRVQIARLLEKMTLQIDLATRMEMKNIIKEFTQKYTGIVDKYATNFGFDIQNSFAGVNTQALNNVVGRVWGDGFKYSDRIWRIQKQSEYGVKEILTNGMARGRGVVDMAKDLRHYMVDPEITSGNSYTTLGAKSVNGRGSIKYQALRLAKTEVNNSYREAQIIASKENPITVGIKWNLSKKHSVKDICDTWAEGDFYKLGPGVYPDGRAPIPHPNDECYFTDVLRPVSEWGKPKPEYSTPDISGTEATSMLEEDSSERKYAIKAFNQMKKLVL